MERTLRKLNEDEVFTDEDVFSTDEDGAIIYDFCKEESAEDEGGRTKSIDRGIKPETPNDENKSGSQIELNQNNVNSEEINTEREDEEKIHRNEVVEWGTVPPSPVRIDSDQCVDYDADDEGDDEPAKTLFELTVTDTINRERVEDNETMDPETNFMPDSPAQESTDETSVPNVPETHQDPEFENVASSSKAQNVRPETPTTHRNRSKLKMKSSSKNQVLDTKTEKLTLSNEVPECVARRRTHPPWWNLWGLWKQRKSLAKVHPMSQPQPTGEMISRTLPVQEKTENPKGVFVSSVEDHEGNLEFKCDAKVRNESKIPQQDAKKIPRPPSRKRGFSNVSKRSSPPPLETVSEDLIDGTRKILRPATPKHRFSDLSKDQTSLETDTRVQIRDTGEILRPHARKHRISDVSKRSSRTRPSLETVSEDRIGDTRSIPRPRTRKHKSSDVSKTRESRECDLEDRIEKTRNNIPVPPTRKQGLTDVSKARPSLQPYVMDRVEDTSKIPRPPSRKHGFTDVSINSSEARTSLIPDIQDRTDDMRKISRPRARARKHGFSDPSKSRKALETGVEDARNTPRPLTRKRGHLDVSKAQPSLETCNMDRIEDMRKIQRPPSRKHGFSEVSTNNIPEESIETRRSIVPDENGTCRKIRVQHAKPQRKVCRTGDPEGRPWKIGKIPHFDLRTSCSRETFKRLMFIREDFKLTPSQEKITDMNEFIAAKTEYLRIKAGGKVKTVDTLHVSKLETKESDEDPNLFGDDAWPLPTGEHIPPDVSLSMKGNMSEYSFEHRLVPVLENDFGVIMLEPDPDPPPSKWKNFKNTFKMRGNRSSGEPNNPSEPRPGPSQPSTSWFGTMKRQIGKKWTKLTGKKKEAEVDKEVEEELTRDEITRAVRDPLFRPESGLGFISESEARKILRRHSRVRKHKKVKREVEASAEPVEENSHEAKPDVDSGKLKVRRHHRKTPKTARTKSERRKSVSSNTQGEGPENTDLKPRRHLSTLSHRRPD